MTELSATLGLPASNTHPFELHHPSVTGQLGPAQRYGSNGRCSQFQGRPAEAM
jgi:hypothetical protein